MSSSAPAPQSASSASASMSASTATAPAENVVVLDDVVAGYLPGVNILNGANLTAAKGELIGINAMLYSQTGSYSGYGFAIPTSIMNKVVDDLKKYGTVTVDKDMCIICVVGDLEWENVGFEAKALDAMRDIPVRMISFGGSNYNISFLIRECDKKVALQSLSDMLFNGK